MLSLIAITGYSQQIKYKCFNKVKFNGMKTDTSYYAVTQTYQNLVDTVERASVNMYMDSTNYVNFTDISKSFTLSWKGYATSRTRQKDSIRKYLAIKLSVGTNKLIEY